MAIVESTGFKGILALKKRILGVPFAVAVGVGPEAKEADGTSVAKIALINNFGVPGHIPERPFLQMGMRRGIRRLKKLNKDNVRLFLRNRISLTDVILRFGEGAVASVKKALQDSRGLFEPNADRTVEKKGFDWPLRETKTLEASIEYKVIPTE